MGERYPKFRHAQQVGGPYRRARRRRRDHQPARDMSTPEIIATALAFGAIAFLAQPWLTSVWRVSTQSPAQLAAIEHSVYYAGCDEARAAGAAPIYRGSPGYRPGMDGDGDGVACEPPR